jgi:hypothetical protein
MRRRLGSTVRGPVYTRYPKIGLKRRPHWSRGIRAQDKLKMDLHERQVYLQVRCRPRNSVCNVVCDWLS